MPLLDLFALRDIIQCPACGSSVELEQLTCCGAACRFSCEQFRSVANQPIFINESDSIVDPSAVAPAREAHFDLAAISGWLNPGNPVAARVTDRMLAEMRKLGTSHPRLLVVGGGRIGSGLNALYEADDLDLIAFDLFPSSHTQFVADAHRIPLQTASVDGIIVQAVLEHVLDPWQVVAEIHRVLRPEGLIYADTPFLQQVHEGPYDFTRFTESGHRWLFRDFSLIDSGVVAGPGVQLAWSLAHIARAVIPLRGVATVVRNGASWPGALIDRLIPRRVAVDGASSVYFLGRRSDQRLRPRDMIAHYRGSQANSVRRT